jgi:glucose-1-phosphate cytidylyltransferase
MKVAILCGGKGTRLREETVVRPKPMVEIGSRPILWHIMQMYSGHGLDQFVLCLGYKGDVIRDYFLHYRLRHSDVTVSLGTGTVETHDPLHFEDDWKITLVETGEHTNTGGRIKRAARYLDGERFMATYGDGVANVDLGALLEFHRAHGKLATVTAVRPSSRFGELAIEGGLVKVLREKPQVGEGWINGGFFVFEHAVLDLMVGDEDSLEESLLGTLISKQQLAVYQHEGFWQCMDTYREWEILNALYKKGHAPWIVEPR